MAEQEEKSNSVMVYQKNDPKKPLIEVRVDGRKVWVDDTDRDTSHDGIKIAMTIAFTTRFRETLRSIANGTSDACDASAMIDEYERRINPWM